MFCADNLTAYACSGFWYVPNNSVFPWNVIYAIYFPVDGINVTPKYPVELLPLEVVFPSLVILVCFLNTFKMFFVFSFPNLCLASIAYLHCLPQFVFVKKSACLNITILPQSHLHL